MLPPTHRPRGLRFLGRGAALTLALGLASLPATAQWSTDPAVNLVLSDRSGEQVQPKVAATADGGAYVSWFDNADGGYDVYLQRLDARGFEQWAHNGILIADRSYSSTQDYGLTVDTAGNALLAYRDDQGAFERVSAFKVSPAGTPLWGPNGIQLTNAPAFVAAPTITGTTDGGAVVAWTQDAEVVAQKLDGAGLPLWGDGVTLSPTGSSLAASDLQPGDAGSAIVALVHSVGASGPRHLWAQKLAGADGAPLWGATPLAIYDPANGSLQFGSFPDFVGDGSGGAVFAWYTSTPSLQCRLQRISSSGVELFAHDGLETSTDGTRLRSAPSAAFDPSRDETFVFWVETNLTQSQFGVYGQKVDGAGIRRWTDEGTALVPLGVSQPSFLRSDVLAGGALVSWIDSVAFGNDPLRGTRVDGDGDFVWSPALTDLATAATSSSRLAGALSSLDFGIYAWSDGEIGGADILAQNLNADGSLGPNSIFAEGFESGDTSAWDATVP